MISLASGRQARSVGLDTLGSWLRILSKSSAAMTIGLSEWYTVLWTLTRGAVRDLAMVETGGHARTVTLRYH